MQAAQFSIGRDVKGDKNKRKGGGETSVCREHLIGKPNWKVCELLHDITANVIRAVAVSRLQGVERTPDDVLRHDTPAHTRQICRSNKKSPLRINDNTMGVS